jgi:hypothetical protein
LAAIKEFKEDKKLVDAGSPCNGYMWIVIKGGLKTVFFDLRGLFRFF